LQANDDAQYELGVADDGTPDKPWPVPKAEEHTAHKDKMLKGNPNALTMESVRDSGELGKFLVNEWKENDGEEWDGSKYAIEYINMSWIKGRHVSLQDFKEHRILGRGGFGLVQGVCRSSSGQMYANKIQNKIRMKDGKAIELAFEEKEALSSVTSPFVVGLHYAFQDAKNIYLILELLSGGDLQFHLNKEKKFTEDVAKYFIASTLQGIGVLHDAGYVYRDLKPENILLSADGNCKITDLGLATKVGDGVTGSAGTRGFFAPEMITKDKDGNKQTYTEVVDFWALGCVVYAFFEGASPFYNFERIKEYDEDRNVAINEATKRMTVEYDSDNFSKKAESFTESLLTRDPGKRLGAKGWRECEKHEFFADFDFDALRNQTMKPPFVSDETLNAKDADDIGEHDETKGVSWDDSDEKRFDDWNYFNVIRFEEEVIASLEWAKENGDLRMKRKSSTCLIM